MSVIGCQTAAVLGMNQVEHSAEIRVDTTDIDLTRNSAVLVDTEDAVTTRDGIEFLTFNCKRGGRYPGQKKVRSPNTAKGSAKVGWLPYVQLTFLEDSIKRFSRQYGTTKPHFKI